jgi:putative flippase GtrA
MEKKKILNVSLLTVLLGAILVGIFRIAYPETSPTHVLALVAIVSMGAAFVLNWIVSRWRSRRKHDGSSQQS